MKYIKEYKEIDFDNDWDFVEDEYNKKDLEYYIGKPINRLNELIGKKVKIKSNSPYWDKNKEKYIGEIVFINEFPIYDRTIVGNSVFYIQVDWFNGYNGNYRLKDLKLVSGL